MTIKEEIIALEDEISNTKYNKATQHHIGKLKAKLAKLRDQATTSSGGAGGTGYSVKKAGHATVSLVGLPSVGKSTILNSITGADSETANYEFTTLDVVPGILKHKDANIQLLDLPGLVAGASRGTGRGKEVLSVIRSSDLILHVVDATDPKPDVILNELEDSGIRLNSSPPNGRVSKTGIGGVIVVSPVKQELEEDTIKDIVRSFGHVNAEVVLRENMSIDMLVDLMAGNRVYMNSFTVLTKIDLASKTSIKKAHTLCKNSKVIDVSAELGTGLDDLKDTIYSELNFISIFMKPQGDKADLEEPLVVISGTTVGQVAHTLHRDFKDKFRYAQVWGPSSKFPGQTVGLKHVLKDGDLLTIITHR